MPRTSNPPDPTEMCIAAIKAVIRRYPDAVADAALAQVQTDRAHPPPRTAGRDRCAVLNVSVIITPPYAPFKIQDSGKAQL